MSAELIFKEIADGIKSTSIIEWIAIITALVYVVLAAMENSWCWIFGIISSGIYVWLNYTVAIYLDSWLSVYYCLVGIYGWYAWVKGKSGDKSGSVLHYISLRALGLSFLIGIAGTFMLGKLSSVYTDSPVPYFDAALTSFSLVATFLTTRKILENWLFWVAIDAAYVIIYWMRGLPSTAILFLIYTFIAAFGFLKWRKTLKTYTA